jgi:hypothetical protein
MRVAGGAGLGPEAKYNHPTNPHKQKHPPKPGPKAAVQKKSP